MPKNNRANRINHACMYLILSSMIILTSLLSGCGGSNQSNYSITGTISTGGAPLAGVTVTLSNGPSSGVSITDANGNYGFGSLSSGTYIITPTLAGYTFVPTARPAYLYGNNAEGFNFSASRGISISATNHTLYAKSDGTIWAWGRNNKSQLGDGTTTDSSIPVQSAPAVLSGMTAVAAGNEHSLALKSDGTVWAWGSNSNGQLGDGTIVNHTIPVQVSGLTNVRAIAAGVNFSLALKNDGSVWAWGYNGSGQLGNNTTTDQWTPVPTAGPGGVTAIAAGFDHTVVMTSGTVVWTWGNNSRGQLGNGTTNNSSVPLLVGSGVTGALAISAGNQFTVVLVSSYLSSFLWAWGNNSDGQLGDTTNSERHLPTQVSGLANMTALTSGDAHSLSLKSDGTAWAWGNNSNGQLGDGTKTSRWTPAQVSGLAGGQGITAGYQDSFASTTVGAVKAWGNNMYGELGDGSTSERLTPVAITLP
jgi:alpha-tubulin suppressor-like RCC1 family protein